eukprot:COSAG06_NODE_584_length_14005_cov_23.423486_1_plen_85_part_00
MNYRTLYHFIMLYPINPSPTISSLSFDLRTDNSIELDCFLGGGGGGTQAPNLQNQPALEKDKYQIRDAFRPEPGNSLVVRRRNA